MAVTRSMTRNAGSKKRCGKGKKLRRKTNRCVKYLKCTFALINSLVVDGRTLPK